MSNAEHLIENALYALAKNEDINEVMDAKHNRMMLEETGIRKEDIIGMASHVMYSLYEGVAPDFPI